MSDLFSFPSPPPPLPVKGNLSSDSIAFEGNVSRARLGMAVQSLGDIDRDGFEGELGVLWTHDTLGSLNTHLLITLILPCRLCSGCTV